MFAFFSLSTIFLLFVVIAYSLMHVDIKKRNFKFYQRIAYLDIVIVLLCCGAALTAPSYSNALVWLFNAVLNAIAFMFNQKAFALWKKLTDDKKTEIES